jgi:hypothetical protein
MRISGVTETLIQSTDQAFDATRVNLHDALPDAKEHSKEASEGLRRFSLDSYIATGLNSNGQQPLSPPQHTVDPEREQRSGLKSNFRLATNWELSDSVSGVRRYRRIFYAFLNFHSAAFPGSPHA